MGLLTKKEQDRLIDLLLKLPNITDPTVRNQLLPGLPRDLQVQIVNPGAPKPHFISIVNTVDNEFWEEPYEGGWPVLQLIENAIFLVGERSGSPIALQLQLLLADLKLRAELWRSASTELTNLPSQASQNLERLKVSDGSATPRKRQMTKEDGIQIVPPTPAYYGMGNHWAVLVGINYYEDETNYGQLHVGVKDVEAIYQQLIMGGFTSNHIHLLTDNTPEELPTRNNILTTLTAIAKATEPDDALFFYFTGHGDEEGRKSYLVPRDARALILKDTAVPISRVKEILQRASARAKVVILDACHAGVNIGQKGPRRMSAAFIQRVFEQAAGIAILASCAKGEFSYEMQTQEHSSFTHFLLEALQGKADRDKKGFVTVQDANRYVSNGVKTWASKRKIAQTPTLESQVSGDIILCYYKS